MVRLSRAKLGPLAIVVLVIVVAVAGFIGVSKLEYPTTASYPDVSEEAGKVEPIPGSELSQVTLSEDAAQKIGLMTTAVTATVVGGRQQLSIPYAAVFYDPLGETWAYVANEPLVFSRQSITVASIQKDAAMLSAGPAVGTKVVTVGSAQLYGTEVGVEEE